MPQVNLPEGSYLNQLINKSLTVHDLEEALQKREILEATAVSCDTGHNLHINLGCMKGVIPHNEGAIGIAEGLTRDIAMISRVGKAVSFTVEGFTYDRNGDKIALLSRKKAQEKCISEYISTLRPGDVIPAKVTHIEAFGAFCDIGCGIAALMPIDTVSVSRISTPKDRFKCGDDIRAVVKSIADGKITLSQKELLGTWEENAAMFSQGETVSGIIRSVESYGVFVELTPNLAGLAESRPGAKVGQHASVYIKSIIPEKMKVKLIIVDAFDSNDTLMPIRYFSKETHIDRWVYSPKNCIKTIESVFNR
ncbi:MAG: S1 RNA-binding domain-containing protein [Ruminococcaceae bacterium]|nr:S1 RNA-binding domain-containing protein [Oscillospiraceae bacterium]